MRILCEVGNLSEQSKMQALLLYSVVESKFIVPPTNGNHQLHCLKFNPLSKLFADVCSELHFKKGKKKKKKQKNVCSD